MKGAAPDKWLTIQSIQYLSKYCKNLCQTSITDPDLAAIKNIMFSIIR